MKNKRIIAIIQARMASNRLPGKVMQSICGKPMLAWVVYRVRKSSHVSRVVVATTISDDDNPIVSYCKENKISFFRGSEFDVLNRYYQTARHYRADIIVRITADCPLIDATIIDKCIELLVNNLYDFVSNRLPPPFKRTYPIGLDVEVVTMSALERAWIEAKEPYQREHVMPYLYEKDRGFKIHLINNEIDYGEYRWTVDTQKDLDFVNAITKKADCKMDFYWEKVLDIINKNPELKRINQDEKHKSFIDIDDRIQKRKK